MPLGLLNLEFLNLNAARRFPLSDDSSGVDTSGTFTLPNEFLVGLDLPIGAGSDVDPSRFFLQQLMIYATGFGLVVGYQPSSGPAVNVATALVPRAVHITNNVYALGGIGDYADTVGRVVIGKLDAIDQQPSGQFTFTLDNARIEPECVRPILRTLGALVVVNGTERSQPLYGDIELVADANIQIVPIVVSGQDPQIRISAIQGEGLAEACVCVGDTQAPPIRRINGVPPTAAGDFTLLGNDCLTINPITNGLQLSDVCSQPCCGCKELETVTAGLEQFGSKATTLENMVNAVSTAVNEMDQVVLGSRLNDRGCAG